MTSTSRSLRMPTTSAVGPGAFSMIWDRYLPRPSWVMPRSTLTPRCGHVHELERVVLAREDRLGQVLADLLLVDVERGHELHVADVVVAQLDVHQARDEVVGLGVLVVVAALDQAAGAVADADDGDADLLAARLGLAVAVVAVAVLAHVSCSMCCDYPCSCGRCLVEGDDDALDDGDGGEERDEPEGRRCRARRARVGQARGRRSPAVPARPATDEPDGEDDEPDLARGEADVGHALARARSRGSRTWPGCS